MKPSEILSKALSIIENKSSWTYGDGARNLIEHKENRYMGEPVRCNDASACKWCWEGAVAHALGREDWADIEVYCPEVHHFMVEAVYEVTGISGFQPWEVNDSMGYEPTLEAARLAVKLAEEHERNEHSTD